MLGQRFCAGTRGLGLKAQGIGGLRFEVISLQAGIWGKHLFFKVAGLVTRGPFDFNGPAAIN